MAKAKKLVNKAGLKRFLFITLAGATGVALAGYTFFMLRGKNKVLDDARSGFQGVV